MLVLTKSWFPVEGKMYVVLGLARSGLATVRWLLNKGAGVIAVDDNPEKVHQAKAWGAQGLESPENIPWDSIAAVVQSPGIPLWLPSPHPVAAQARYHGVPVIGEGDLFRRAHPYSRFIGITGTNGKSTTTALVGHILKICGVDCQIGGNIGTPMLDLPEAFAYVLELSSYQLELFGPLNLDIAAWLNITPDHLERHGSLEGYVAAKKQLFLSSSREQTAVMGIDDPLSESVWRVRSARQPTVPVSVAQPLKGGVSVQDGWLMDNLDPIVDLTSLPFLRGIHNFQNVAVAYGVCRVFGLGPQEIVEGIRTFPGLAHRQEWVRTIKGVSFINDSKGTNAAATANALEVFDRIYWIAGGKAKSEGIAPLISYFPKIVHTFLIGEAQDHFAQTLDGKVSWTKSGTLEKAVKDAWNQAVADGLPNSVILLSPACASFDQFQDFEHRGEIFRRLVEEIKEPICP